MKRTSWFISLLVSAALATGITYALMSKTATNSPPKLIAQTDIDANILARALDLQIYAFEIPLPGQESTLQVWLERWTRDAQEPQLFGLLTVMGTMDQDSGKLTVCLPTTAHPQSFVDWTTHGGKTRAFGPNVTDTPIKSSISGSTTLPQPIDMKEISGTMVIEPRPMVLGQDIPLLSLQYNKSGIVHGKTENVEKDADITWYLRARFIPGNLKSNVLTWKDGKVDIQ